MESLKLVRNLATECEPFQNLIRSEFQYLLSGHKSLKYQGMSRIFILYNNSDDYVDNDVIMKSWGRNRNVENCAKSRGRVRAILDFIQSGFEGLSNGRQS